MIHKTIYSFQSLFVERNKEKKWKYYREEKKDFEIFLKSLNIKMSVKLEIKRTDPLGCHVPSVLRQMKNTNFEYTEILDWDTVVVLKFQL